MNRLPIAYTYEADHHCEACAILYVGGVDADGYVTGTDSEGNEVGAVFSWDEWYNIGHGNDTLVCSDCGAILATYDEE